LALNLPFAYAKRPLLLIAGSQKQKIAAIEKKYSKKLDIDLTKHTFALSFHPLREILLLTKSLVLDFLLLFHRCCRMRGPEVVIPYFLIFNTLMK